MKDLGCYQLVNNDKFVTKFLFYLISPPLYQLVNNKNLNYIHIYEQTKLVSEQNIYFKSLKDLMMDDSLGFQDYCEGGTFKLTVNNLQLSED